MYAQCPECLTFFHLKPSHLKAANGRVRCSRCKHVFNALETLRDDVTVEEIAAVEAARRREPKADAPLLNEEYAGDLFDGLEYTRNEELGLDTKDTGADEQTAPPVEATEPELASDPLAAPAREVHDFGAPRPRKRRPLPATLGVVALLLALAVQIVHWQRFEILEHPAAGPLLARTYDALGLDLQPPRDLAALKISRTAVGSHPDHPRALHVTAVIENTANNVQPWPELYVDLQDRWGETVAARYFTPAEYLREPADAEQSLRAGARHAVELAILDPGVAAVGFQLDPCFANGSAPDARRVCAADLNSAN